MRICVVIRPKDTAVITVLTLEARAAIAGLEIIAATAEAPVPVTTVATEAAEEDSTSSIAPVRRSLALVLRLAIMALLAVRSTSLEMEPQRRAAGVAVTDLPMCEELLLLPTVGWGVGGGMELRAPVLGAAVVTS